MGSFGAIIVAMLRLLTPMRRLSRVNAPLQKGIVATESIYNLLDEPLEIDEGTRELKQVIGAVEFADVTFRFNRTKAPVLQGIRFSLRPGEVVALVGHSGSGKSTLVNLLMRFYDVTEGEILIDGVDSRAYRLSDLRQQIASGAE